jgi:hypothetical protein
MEGYQRSSSTYMRNDCEDEVRARIGNLILAKEVYNKLKTAYEGKTVTIIYALLHCRTNAYGDRKSTIEEHTIAYG